VGAVALCGCAKVGKVGKVGKVESCLKVESCSKVEKVAKVDKVEKVAILSHSRYSRKVAQKLLKS
jgi:hypothetical protein